MCQLTFIDVWSGRHKATQATKPHKTQVLKVSPHVVEVHSEIENATVVEGAEGEKDLSPTSKLRFEFEMPTAENQDVCEVRKEMSTYETMKAAPKNESVLGWWNFHGKSLPLLAKLARRILTIPASSGKSERVFSTAGIFVQEKRTRLNSKKVENLIIIKENKIHIDGHMKKVDVKKVETVNACNAFEKVKVTTITGILDSDDEESDTEYFVEEDLD